MLQPPLVTTLHDLAQLRLCYYSESKFRKTGNAKEDDQGFK